jgi:hypothetical protein
MFGTILWYGMVPGTYRRTAVPQSHQQQQSPMYSMVPAGTMWYRYHTRYHNTQILHISYDDDDNILLLLRIMYDMMIQQ